MPETTELDFDFKYELRKYNGPPPRRGRASMIAKKYLKIPEKQPYLVIRGGDSIPQSAEEVVWEPSKARLVLEYLGEFIRRTITRIRRYYATD